MQSRISLAIAMVALFLAGCENAGPSTAPATEGGGAVQASASKTGAELWAENCNRCHNYRPPPSFSDAQWETVVMHMRLRADLTGEERKKITEFMKTANH